LTGSDDNEFPESLARQLGPDLALVRPLLRFELRSALIALLAASVAAMFLWHAGIRTDAGTLPPATLAMFLVFRVAAGTGLILLAMREAIPAAGWSDRMRRVALFVAVAGLFLLPEVFARTIGYHGRGSLHSLNCFLYVLAVSVPALALTFALLARAYPLRPVATGTVAGLGAGMLAEAAIFIACDNAARVHGMAVHGGAVITAGLCGAIAGWLIGRARAHAETDLSWRM
jgi:hypothetical protein